MPPAALAFPRMAVARRYSLNAFQPVPFIGEIAAVSLDSVNDNRSGRLSGGDVGAAALIV